MCLIRSVEGLWPALQGTKTSGKSLCGIAGFALSAFIVIPRHTDGESCRRQSLESGPEACRALALTFTKRLPAPSRKTTMFNYFTR